MGCFSWKCSDDDRQIVIGNDEEFALLLPNGEKLIDTKYDGYGHVCGKDIYALVAMWNREEVKQHGYDFYSHRGGYSLGSPECKKDYLSDMSDEEFEKKWDEDHIREIGIDIACYDEQNAALEKPIKLVHDTSLNYDEVKASESDPNQGFLDEEIEEDEYDDEYDDDYFDDYDPDELIDDEECGHDDEW